MRIGLVAVFGLCAAMSFAADVPGFAMWKSAELKGMEKELGGKGPVSTKAMAKFGNHLIMTAHREASGTAEIHEHVADFFVVESGGGTLVVGGKAPGAKQTEPGELRGPRIEGGEKHRIAAGDIVHIPANTPHQVLLDPGQQITYVTIKVDTGK
jgi:mannose-6-phosphate isomerase-like protein (cupin superfamily)